MRKARRIYKRKSRSNLETFIILMGAIIILGIAFFLARDKSYIPPEEPVIAEEERTLPPETAVVERFPEIVVEKDEEKETEKVTTEVIEKETVPPEKPLVTEPTAPVVAKTPPAESGVKILKESEIVSEKKVYTVQVGAFSSEKNAQNLAQEIKEKGFDTYVIQGENLYKVQVGEFKSSEEAQKVSQKLKELGYPIFITNR